MPRLSFALHPTTLRLKHPFTIARETSTTKTAFLLEARLGDATGWGEAVGSARYGQTPDVIETGLARWIAQISPRASSIEEVRQTTARMDGLPSGVRMGIDLALLDLAGQIEGLAAHEILGLPEPAARETSFTIGLDTPECMTRKAREAAAFPILKVKMGAAGDLSGLEAVHAAHPGRLRVDANEGWTPEGAHDRLPALRACGVELIEQPFPAGSYDALRELRAAAGIPIFVDEDVVTIEDLERIAGAADGITVKLMKHGGLTAAATLVRRATALGLTTMLGCMIESSVGITAACHLTGVAALADLDGHLLITNDPFRGAAVTAGRIALPPGIRGLGVTPAR